MPQRTDEGSGRKKVADLGERGLLELIAPFVTCGGKGVRMGFGDDCAVMKPPRGAEHEVLTADMLVEGTHFLNHNATNWEWLGRKAVAVNISDLAAMGAEPQSLLVSLGLPGHTPAKNIVALYRGLSAEAKRWGASLIGGDTVSSPQIVINIAATGWIPAGWSLPLRSKCKVGQHVYVSGGLGGSRAGLEILMDPNKGRRLGGKLGLRLAMRHQLPVPRLELGRALAAGCPDLAMIDVSDSLSNELGLLAEASSVGFEIEVERLPAFNGVKEYCAATQRPLLELLMFSGEEYELLFTTSRSLDEIRRLLKAAKTKVRITRIGRVSRSRGVNIVDVDRNTISLKDSTFRHFR